MIDGKPTPLSGTDLIICLKSVPAVNIRNDRNYYEYIFQVQCCRECFTQRTWDSGVVMLSYMINKKANFSVGFKYYNNLLIIISSVIPSASAL